MTTTTPAPKKRTGPDPKWDAVALTILLATYELLRRETNYRLKRTAICDIMASDDYIDAPWNRGGYRLNAGTIHKTLSRAMSTKHNPVTPLFFGKPDTVEVIKRQIKERALAGGYASLISARDVVRAARQIREDDTRRTHWGADLIIEKMAWRPPVSK